MIVLLSAFFLLFQGSFVFAADNLDNALGKPLKDAAGSGGAGYNVEVSTDIESFIGFILNIILSFLGVIFLILMIYGGYIWMIARGNEQEVEKAKNIIIAAIIGLVIVIAAYAISWYVIDVLGGKALKPTTNTAPAVK